MDILSSQLSDDDKELYLPIAEFLKTHNVIRNPDVQGITQRGSATANRYLARLVELQIVDPKGENKGRIYRRRKG